MNLNSTSEKSISWSNQWNNASAIIIYILVSEKSWLTKSCGAALQSLHILSISAFLRLSLAGSLSSTYTDKCISGFGYITQQRFIFFFLTSLCFSILTTSVLKRGRAAIKIQNLNIIQLLVRMTHQVLCICPFLKYSSDFEIQQNYAFE